eukprot:5866682-Alexandrium_andersonii.AAC.1
MLAVSCRADWQRTARTIAGLCAVGLAVPGCRDVKRQEWTQSPEDDNGDARLKPRAAFCLGFGAAIARNRVP